MTPPAAPLVPLTRSVAKARRRLFLQALVTRLPQGWSAALALGAAWVAAEPSLVGTADVWVRFGPVGGLVALGTAAAGAWAWRATPSAAATALEIDNRFQLDERLTTALSLTEPERATPAGVAVLADAEAKVSPLAVTSRFPVQPRWHAGFVPVLAGCVALAAIYPFAYVADVIAGTASVAPAALSQVAPGQPVNPAAAKPFTQRNKPAELAERADKSKELKDLEDQINAMMNKYDTDPNRETPEKLKEKVTEMTSMEQKVQKFNDEKIQKLEKLQEALQQLDRNNKDPEFDDGPAKKLNDALSKGDLKEAEKELDQLKKKAKNKELTKDDQEKLSRQLDKMKKATEQLQRDKERTDKLKDLADKARKEGREQDAETLERELEKAQKEQAEAQEAAEQLAEKFQKAKDALDKGQLEEAAKELGEAAQKLEATEAELQDLEEVQDYLQRLKDDKKKACKGCEGQCESDGEKDFAKGAGRGSGKREENKDAVTDNNDERIRGLFDPRGKKTYGGTTKGTAFKTASTGELGPAIQSAAQDAPAAADSQRLTRDAKESVKDYFQNFGGQK